MGQGIAAQAQEPELGFPRTHVKDGHDGLYVTPVLGMGGGGSWGGARDRNFTGIPWPGNPPI